MHRQPFFGEEGRFTLYLQHAGTAVCGAFVAVCLTSGALFGRQTLWPLLPSVAVFLGQSAAALTLFRWQQEEGLGPRFQYLAAGLALLAVASGCTILAFAFGVVIPGRGCAALGVDRVCIDTKDPAWCRAPAPADCFWEVGSCVVNQRCGLITSVSEPERVGPQLREINYTCSVTSRLRR